MAVKKCGRFLAALTPPSVPQAYIRDCTATEVTPKNCKEPSARPASREVVF